MHAHQKNTDASVVTSRHYICDADLGLVGKSRHLQFLDGQNYLTRFDYQPEHFLSFKKEKYYQSQGLCKNNSIGDDLELLYCLKNVGI